ncbi:hypothetical protein [Deinococcus roseus]|uniref:Uncharacterized protein n=1 Tax=Deinococcus roseus TaxID=392414 RepID=A0ABQ2CYB0_9DEIO|nr:hypothetical protein [Deinococcus roseus]GGJ28074.1 hypothetical protein GCM10008938_12720 [Deinococcus roseus]
MHTYLLLAGLLLTLIGIVHSVLGEVLIFKRLRKGTRIPTWGALLLKESHVRILWATWHLASVLGWGLAALLFRLAFSADPANLDFFKTTLALSTFAGGFLVLIGTNGKHPGWVGLWLVALLIWLD